MNKHQKETIDILRPVFTANGFETVAERMEVIADESCLASTFSRRMNEYTEVQVTVRIPESREDPVTAWSYLFTDYDRDPLPQTQTAWERESHTPERFVAAILCELEQAARDIRQSMATRVRLLESKESMLRLWALRAMDEDSKEVQG